MECFDARFFVVILGGQRYLGKHLGGLEMGLTVAASQKQMTTATGQWQL
jgi:hypothetical protein